MKDDDLYPVPLTPPLTLPSEHPACLPRCRRKFRMLHMVGPAYVTSHVHGCPNHPLADTRPERGEGEG